MAALARWKSAPHAANTSKGRLASSVLQGDRRVPCPTPSGERPRATSWSMAPSGTAQAAPVVAAAVKPIIQNTMLEPRNGAASRITRLIAPLPRWNNASFRSARRAKRAGPTTPSDIAARQGPIVVPASPPITPAAATGQNRGASGTNRHVAGTTTTAPASNARFARSASTMAPSGTCDTKPTKPPKESAKPMLAASQPCSVRR